MVSPRGFAGAVVFLAALPVAALCDALAGAGEVGIHLTFALGAALMALAIFDFRTPRWIGWMGCAASVFLAVTFLLQGGSMWANDDALIHFAYQILGQRLEAWAGDLFLLWCLAVLLVHSRGWTKIVGAAAMALAIGMRGYAYWLSFHGRSLGTEAPLLQALALLPFLWLVLEAGRPKEHPQGATSRAARVATDS